MENRYGYYARFDSPSINKYKPLSKIEDIETKEFKNAIKVLIIGFVILITLTILAIEFMPIVEV